MTNQFGTIAKFIVDIITIEEKSFSETRYLAQNKWALDLSEDIWAPILEVKPWLVNKPRTLSRGFTIGLVSRHPYIIDLLGCADEELVEIAGKAWVKQHWESREGWCNIPERIKSWEGLDQMWVKHLRYMVGSMTSGSLPDYMAAFPRRLHTHPEVVAIVLSNYWYALWAVKHTWKGFTTLEMRSKIVALFPQLTRRDERLKVKPYSGVISELTLKPANPDYDGDELGSGIDLMGL